ncbi:hypothetical protein [uncultured Phascolarctobacterium sp.]|uniref:hypothetical protein n=1 Tax=uncultured Phascolarctobacterium sp. TaxID=512296 RepID=UPI0025EAC5C9|nr:hypothetical protein [uncultured Phascolarctobacterium sp.]
MFYVGLLIAIAVVVYLMRNPPAKSYKEDDMQGLQTFDEDGKINIDITDRLVKYCGKFDAWTLTGSITDKAIDGKDVWFAYTCNPTANLDKVLRFADLHFQQGFTYPELIVNGDTITWKFHNVERPFYYGSGGSLNMDKVVPDLRVTIYYGVY